MLMISIFIEFRLQSTHQYIDLNNVSYGFNGGISVYVYVCDENSIKFKTHTHTYIWQWRNSL